MLSITTTYLLLALGAFFAILTDLETGHSASRKQNFDENLDVSFGTWLLFSALTTAINLFLNPSTISAMALYMTISPIALITRSLGAWWYAAYQQRKQKELEYEKWFFHVKLQWHLRREFYSRSQLDG